MFKIDSPYEGGKITGKSQKKLRKVDPEEEQVRVENISLHLQTYANPLRGIPQDIYAFFGVRHTLTPAGVLDKTYYPYTKNGVLSGYKERTQGKDFYAIGDLTEVSMFGSQQAAMGDGGTLYITEGEEDTIALWKAIWDYQAGGDFAGNKPKVVSLPHGVGTPNMTEEDKILISQAQKIHLVLDNDEAGQDCLGKLTAILPMDKVFIVKLPLKDASEMVKSGRSKELAELALFSKETYQPATIIEVGDLLTDLDVAPSTGYKWPWDELTQQTYGIQPGRIYGIGGGVGSSKSLFCHHVLAGLLDQDIKVASLSLEESPQETLRSIVGIREAAIFNRPDIPYPPSQLAKAVKKIEGLLYLSKEGEIDGVEQAYELITYLAVLKDVKVIVVDPISDLVAGVSASVGNEHLNWFLKSLEKLAQTQGVAFILASHLNPPSRGYPHEEGGSVSLQDFTGSRALMRKASVCFGIERNAKGKDGLDLYNRIVKLKGRGCNPNAAVDLWTHYDVDSGRMKGTLTHPVTLVDKEDGGSRGSSSSGGQPIKLPWED